MDHRPWRRLKQIVEKQIAESGFECEVLVNTDSGQYTSGEKRNELTLRASGEYIAFIDDDDDVEKGYVDSLCIEIQKSHPDVVSFSMMFLNSKNRKKEIWRLGLHEDSRVHGKMSVNHLCCWKKEVASKVAWCESLGYGDDQIWYQPLVASRSDLVCVSIPRVLYRYNFNPSLTLNQTTNRVESSRKYFGDGLRCFMISPGEILIEDGSQKFNVINCRDRNNKTFCVDTKNEVPFYTVRLK
tara:strand:- start:181 stop:903 length:723 start_codon:yes stop_codon:yes gene_type:complete